MLKDFLALIYPNLCFGCQKNLQHSENGICTYCEYELPKTNFHLDEDNPVAKVFWGRVPIENGTAFYYFNKESKIQKLLHQLKYRGEKQIGELLGKIAGFELKSSAFYNEIDYMMPIPLHPLKQKRRGYNQSEQIAIGLSEALNIQVNIQNIFRKEINDTQTKKTRYARWENIQASFEIKNINMLKNKHILLVDDVITTGSTLEACAQKLHNEVEGIRISVFALAYTK